MGDKLICFNGMKLSDDKTTITRYYNKVNEDSKIVITHLDGIVVTDYSVIKEKDEELYKAVNILFDEIMNLRTRLVIAEENK